MKIKQKINEIVDRGVSPEEIHEIENLKQEFARLSPVEKKEVQEILDRAISKARAGTKITLEELKNSVCENISKVTNFENLAKKPGLEHLRTSFENYFSSEIEKKMSSCSVAEKNSLKILFWGKFLDIFSVESSLGRFLDSMQGKVVSNVEKLQEVKKPADLSLLFEEATEFFADFSTDAHLSQNINTYFTTTFAVNIERVLAQKEKFPSQDISDLAVLSKIIEGKKSKDHENSEQIYSHINAQAEKIGASFRSKKELGIQLGSAIENLPFKTGDSIKDFIRGVVENYPFLGFLVGLIMGPDFLSSFLSKKDGDIKKSLQELKNFSEENDCSLKGVLNQDFLTQLDEKKMNPFFNFMKSEKIDVTEKDFWKELLQGKSENPKLEKIHTLLKSEYGEKILSSKDTTNERKEFYKKLNNIEALASREEIQKAEATVQNQATALPPVIVSTPTLSTVAISPNPINTIPPIGAPKKELSRVELIKKYTDFRDIAISTALHSSFNLPIAVSYKGKEAELTSLGIIAPKSIDFRDGTLSIDGKNYAAKFKNFEVTSLLGTHTIKELRIVGNPTVSKESVQLSYETENLGFGIGVQKGELPLNKEKLQNIVFDLIKNQRYTGKIPAKGNIPEISFSLS